MLSRGAVAVVVVVVASQLELVAIAVAVRAVMMMHFGAVLGKFAKIILRSPNYANHSYPWLLLQRDPLL